VQLRQPLLGRRDPRLELALVHQSLTIRVNQSRDAAAYFFDLCIELLIRMLLRVIAFAIKSAVQFTFHARWVGQQ
jgi:hypothetical protein